jgi:hypothetical protein
MKKFECLIVGVGLVFKSYLRLNFANMEESLEIVNPAQVIPISLVAILFSPALD